MKKRLSRIPFTFSGSADPELENDNENDNDDDNDTSNVDLNNQLTDDSYGFETGNHYNLYNEHIPAQDEIYPNESTATNHSNIVHGKSDSYDQDHLYTELPLKHQQSSSSLQHHNMNLFNNGALQKLNKSTTSLTNSITSSIHKLPYKSSHNTNSTLALNNKKSVPHISVNKSNPSSGNTINGTGICAITSNNNSNTNSYNTVPNSYISSPNKSSSRYLATNNDHTFMLTKNQQNGVLQPPQPFVSKPSHSPSHSVVVAGDTTSPSKTVQTQQNNGNHHQIDNTLSAPTMIAPIYKTHSAGTQSSNGHSISASTTGNNGLYPSTNNQSATFTIASSIDPSIATSNTNSLNPRSAKKGTGLLQTAYRSAHQSHVSLNHPNGSKVKNVVSSASTNDSNIFGSTESNYEGSTLNKSGSTDLSNNNSDEDVNCIDLNYHIISPKIICKFKLLDSTIRSGINKRIEQIQLENSEMISEIKSKYKELDDIQDKLVSQIKDLDAAIDSMQNQKTEEISNLDQHDLFKNLNDLNVRIDTVKENMEVDKSTLTLFEKQLNTLAELKVIFENRNKLRKKMLTISSIIVFSILAWKFMF